MSAVPFKGEKLIGRSNYIEWLIEAELYLKVNGFMPYILGIIKEPNRTLYFDKTEDGIIEAKSAELAIKYEDKLDDYNNKNSRALAALQSTISPNNIKRFINIYSAKDLWLKLRSDFGDTSLELAARYYNKITSARYSNFKTIEEYISEIQSSALYLRSLKENVSNTFILITIFNSLPSSFNSFISRKYEEIGKDLNNIDLDELVSDLIGEESRMNQRSDSKLEANKAFIRPSSLYTHCNKKGYIKDKCFILYPELKKSASNHASKDKKKSNNKR